MNTDDLTRMLYEIIDSAIKSDDAYADIESVALVDEQTIGIETSDGSQHFLSVEPA